MGQSKLRMHQSIAGYMFEGPYPNFERIQEVPGLWAVITTDTREYYLLDIGYSQDIKSSLVNNPRGKCWEEFDQGQMLYAFFHEKDTDEEKYNLILRDIRKNYENIPCGN
ncbi:hypothetical protein GF319_06800 [Candidatus Bathyarchaeota archaeon]|nr:hypothetical protein [Candidatus Bathyarchaeota archaeon]